MPRRSKAREKTVVSAWPSAYVRVYRRHDDGDVVADERAHLREDVIAVDVGQHHIEQYEVERLRAQLLEGVGRCAHG